MTLLYWLDMSSESWRGFKKGSIEGQHLLPSPDKEKLEGRSFQEYQKELGLEKTEIENKHILDLGSGPTARLERELKGKAFVVSLSPDYEDDEYRGWLKGNKGKVEHAVAGLGQALPFKEESFDTICIYHVFEHTSLEKAEEMTRESIRVLKIGGRVHIMPVELDELKNRLESLAGELGIKIYFEEVNRDFHFNDATGKLPPITIKSRSERAILEKVEKKENEKPPRER